MSGYFLFFLYLFFGILLLHYRLKKKQFPFSIYHTSSIVLFKVLMGCLYGWVFLRFYGGDDTWNYFYESKDETARFLQHPVMYFREFSPAFSLEQKQYHLWDALRFYIQNFERWFFIKGLGLLNLLSASNYYTNVVLFEFGMIPGQLILFSLLIRTFPQRAGMHFLLIFFFPSVIFWCSGIRAEALILLFISFTLNQGYRYASTSRFKYFAGMFLGIAGILLIRYQFLAVFLPALVAYVISLRKQENGALWFIRIFGCCVLIFAISLFLQPEYQLSRPVVHAQQQFFVLHGNTRFALDTLKPGVVSFVRTVPQALTNGLFRPYPWEGKSMLQSFSSVDVIFLVAGLIAFLAGPKRKGQIFHPVYWFFLFYGVGQILLIGLTVPFPGAIVRYRGLPFLFLFLFLYAGNPMLQQKLRYWIFKLH